MAYYEYWWFYSQGNFHVSLEGETVPIFMFIINHYGQAQTNKTMQYLSSMIVELFCRL